MSEPYKNSCDHCGESVNKKYWTFDLDQCVVCDDKNCKSKQKEILRKAMTDSVDDIFFQMLESHKEQK